MNEDKLQLKQQQSIRKTLRYGGLIALCIGGLLTLIGIVNFAVSFFSAFGSSEPKPPRYFWCVFLGMPIVFVGTVMTMFGFMGAINRYVAGESAPVAKDAVNYVGENIQPGVKSIAKAVTEGIKEGLNKEQDKKS